ncbi:hypothetical protein SDC9_197352 [bioreactor metagenome]|uniref:Uncharacterized protein n=1 Tax=bioreactor metagenome TaxID=1076179 RepID=A0A645IF45_9ZZZZ
MSRWSTSYSHGVLISFEFVKHLRLQEQVRAICNEKGWEFEEMEGDLGILRRMLEGDWNSQEVLLVEPGRRIVASNDERIITTQ